MVDIPAGTPLANAVQWAQQALQAGDYPGATELYHRATALVEQWSDPRRADLCRALWSEHVGGLIERERFDEATSESRKYLQLARQSGDVLAQAILDIWLAEALAAQDDLRGCGQTLSEVEELITRYALRAEQLDGLAPHAVRLRGLLAAEHGGDAQAISLLLAALEAFEAVRNPRGVRAVLNDLRRIALIRGSAAAVDEILHNITSPDTLDTDEVLLLARALRRDARYEAAARLLRWRLAREVSPRLRFPLLHELVLLYQILAEREMVERLLPLLEETAKDAADPAEAQAAVERLWSFLQGATLTAGTSFDAQIENARAEIEANHLPEAGAILRRLHPDANGPPRLVALWSLAAGELEIETATISTGLEAQAHAEQALDYLANAADLAFDASLPEIYVQAVQTRGQVYHDLLNDLDSATRSWAQAERAQERIAGRQETDLARIRFLEARPTVHDRLIEAAAKRAAPERAAVEREVAAGAPADLIAAVIVAIEAARASAVLKFIVPPTASTLRDLPLPNDRQACWDWYRRISRQIPRDMAVWLIHATPNHVYHGLIGDEILSWTSVPAERSHLSSAVDDLRFYWADAENLGVSVRDHPDAMPDQLAAIAAILQPCKVLAELPKRVRRLAIVAGDMLSEIPFAALLLDNGVGNAEPLIARYALSDLPCLSAQAPLQRRAVATRGDRGLIVRPRDTNLPILRATATDRTFDHLVDQEATIEVFERRLAEKQYPLLQVDCHGRHDPQRPGESWLQLTPNAPDKGHLTVQRFESLRLSGCGTLILGACESGMAQRIGRDERLGFVRSAFAAGASSIVAARWIAEDHTTVAILSRFRRYLRYLPRDRALQQAQLDVLHGRCPEITTAEPSVPRPTHLAWWACWTLYGDAGYQTRTHPLVRWLRQLISRRLTQ
jgi:hypothetical protein